MFSFKLPIEFTPKLFSSLQENYTRRRFIRDIIAGIIVGIVALPLAIAFAIASGVSPEKGIYTAIIGGFIISFLGGSRVQIGGPTGAFILTVSATVGAYGLEGLTIATFMAGIMVVVMGVAKLGSVIKYIPRSVIIGFTSGIALIIFSTQIKEFLGLNMDNVPSDFLFKWSDYLHDLHSINWWATSIAIFTVLIILYLPRYTTRVPGSLVAIVLSTLAVLFFEIPVDTISDRFGSLSASLPSFSFPIISYEKIKLLIMPAFTIAILIAIESLLSAVVADGMTGFSHRSNMELVAQGVANIGTSLFGGIPATGAIARTATNIKLGGRTPVAGIVHAITLLLIVLFLGRWAKLIPLSTLAGILVIVAYNMSEWKSFVTLLKGPTSDAMVLVVTFLLTVLIDLTVAIEVGMVLSAFIFMKRMAAVTTVSVTSYKNDNEEESTLDHELLSTADDVLIYDINGPMFFGAAQELSNSLKITHSMPKYLVLRMIYVPMIDATGLYNLADIIKYYKKHHCVVILSGVKPEVISVLQKGGVDKLVGEANICTNIKDAIDRVKELKKAALLSLIR